ncbi:hypothetical protein BAA08_13605 [Bizionia sp. APA-3]|nr:hypothetical protein BAA08_13605 [Bizionia sp. APA-3]
MTSCGTTQTVSSEVETFINTQNFTVIKPEKWHAFKSHGYVSYTPLSMDDNPFQNSVSVFQFQLTNDQSFEEFVQVRINETNNSRTIIKQESYSEKNRLGTIYIHNLESTFQGHINKEFSVYFQHNGNYYNYNYSSLKNLYKKHHDDAMAILESIAFI